MNGLAKRLAALEGVVAPEKDERAAAELFERLERMAERFKASGDMANDPNASPAENVAKAFARGDWREGMDRLKRAAEAIR